MNKKTATWVTAAVLASLASPILARAPTAQVGTATAQSIPGPVPGYAVSEAYARLVARQTYFWAWPMVNVYNRLLAMRQVPQPGLNGGIVPVAPPNHLSMLHDYIEPQERFVACPNQDVVYGSAIFDLNQTPVVVQVPDFGSRFWVYQAVDLRTDGFASLGKLYGTRPGFYLFVGPDWHGQVPKGIRQVFRSATAVGSFIPRVFMDDTPEDRAAVQTVIGKIGLYPLSEFDGKVKVTDWSKLPSFGSGETSARRARCWPPRRKILRSRPPSWTRRRKPMPIWSRRCSTSIRSASRCRLTGTPSATARNSAPTTSRVRRWRSPTFSSTSRTRRSTSMPTPTLRASVSTARSAIR
jgi:hypothetical protein